MSRRRMSIAANLVRAKRITAMLTTINEIDMSAVMELRKRRRDEVQGAQWRRPGLHVVLHQGGRRRAQGVFRGSTTRNPRHEIVYQQLLRHRRRGEHG